MITQRLMIHGRYDKCEVEVFLPKAGAEFAAQPAIDAGLIGSYVVVHLKSTAKIPDCTHRTLAEALETAEILNASCPSASLVSLTAGEFKGNIPPMTGPREQLEAEVRSALCMPPRAA